jgi:hypothetical protein
MSDEQQQAAIGRAMEEYVASKKKLAALQQEVAKQSRILAQVSQALGGLYQANVGGVPQSVAVLMQETANFPTADSLHSLALDIRAESDRRQQLYTTLKNMGFEPKD